MWFSGRVQKVGALLSCNSDPNRAPALLPSLYAPAPKKSQAARSIREQLLGPGALVQQFDIPQTSAEGNAPMTIATFRDAHVDVGDTDTEVVDSDKSFFPGYVYKPVQCSRCQAALGYAVVCLVARSWPGPNCWCP